MRTVFGSVQSADYGAGKCLQDVTNTVWRLCQRA